MIESFKPLLLRKSMSLEECFETTLLSCGTICVGPSGNPALAFIVEDIENFKPLLLGKSVSFEESSETTPLSGTMFVGPHDNPAWALIVEANTAHIAIQALYLSFGRNFPLRIANIEGLGQPPEVGHTIIPPIKVPMVAYVKYIGSGVQKPSRCDKSMNTIPKAVDNYSVAAVGVTTSTQRTS